MKNRKQKRKMPLQSIAFGCTLLAAVLAGAWLLFPLEDLIRERLPQLFKPAAVNSSASAARNTGSSTAAEEEDLSRQCAMTATDGVEELLPAAAEESLECAQKAEPPASVETGGKVATPMSCAQAADSLRHFLAGLEKKTYIKEFGLKQPMREHFEVMKEKLSAKLPVVERETDDLYTVLSNMTYFFRVLGRSNIRLIKAVLEQEQDSLEDVAAAIYATSVVADSCPADAVQVPFDMVYEYAGFFLNTIGGRACLFRRDAKSRLLASYYSMLAVDLASRKKLNSHGLRIGGMIPALIRDMESTNQLARKEEYLARLRELKEQNPAD